MELEEAVILGESLDQTTEDHECQTGGFRANPVAMGSHSMSLSS